MSLNKFRKIAYIERFLRLFRHCMRNYAIKSSTFTKLGNFSIKYQSLKKKLAPMARKMYHLTQFSPKISKACRFAMPSEPQHLAFNDQSGHPSGLSPQFVPWPLPNAIGLVLTSWMTLIIMNMSLNYYFSAFSSFDLFSKKRTCKFFQGEEVDLNQKDRNWLLR